MTRGGGLPRNAKCVAFLGYFFCIPLPFFPSLTHSLFYPFECDSERIIKIALHLPKLSDKWNRCVLWLTVYVCVWVFRESRSVWILVRWVSASSSSVAAPSAASSFCSVAGTSRSSGAPSWVVPSHRRSSPVQYCSASGCPTFCCPPSRPTTTYQLASSAPTRLL